MADRLVEYAQLLLRSRTALEGSINGPVLVWRTPQEMGPEEGLFGTDAGIPLTEPSVGQPLVIEVKKRGDKRNAFRVGVTVGRSDSNDVVVAHRSVSRFHGYFQRGESDGRWTLIDAESRNGTWLAKERLRANRPHVLTEREVLRFGSVEMEFFLPGAFITYLADLMGRH